MGTVGVWWMNRVGVGWGGFWSVGWGFSFFVKKPIKRSLTLSGHVTGLPGTLNPVEPVRGAPRGGWGRERGGKVERSRG